MKNHSVLIRRALIFTAIVAFVAVAVGLPTFLALNRHYACQHAWNTLLPQARLLASSTGTEGFEGEASLIAQMGGQAWLTDMTGTSSVTDESMLPDAVTDTVASALAGTETLGTARASTGALCAFAATPVLDEQGSVQGALMLILPVNGAPNPVFCALVSLFAALLAAGITAYVLVHKMLVSVVKPIWDIRDVAVALSEGDLTKRADDKLPGEVGQLANALNNVSMKLSASMYDLIVERNRLKLILDGLSEGIVGIDLDGKVSHTNSALEKLFKRKMILHAPDPRMKIVPDKSVWDDFDAVLKSGETISRSLEVRDMTIRMTITPMQDELGTIAGAVGLFSDITQMERLERTRREYVSNVSHELRTPLTAVRALVEPLRDGLVNTEADRMRYYDIILREVMRLSRLINDQLELSRLQSGTLSIQKSFITLDDMIYDVCERYGSIAAEKGLELLVPTDFSGCPKVYANEDRVEQLLIILLDNAIKYTESGSVSLLGSWDDEKVTLTVKDTGIGIAEADLPYVFDRFYKVDKAHSGKGSGLGLSIAQELQKRMGEEIWVSSEQGSGTEFSFTVHRQPCEDDQEENEDTP